MKYYSSLVLNHICISHNTCFKCYSIHSGGCEIFEDAFKCPLCNILFYERECYDKHLLNKAFTNMKCEKLRATPCQYYFYCENVVPRYFWMKGSFHRHDCDKVARMQCKTYAKSPHYCFINILDDMGGIKKDNELPIFLFLKPRPMKTV